MSKSILFLDDDYERYYTLKHNHPEWEITWVQTVSAFIECARKHHYDEIWLDHDLGYFVMNWVTKDIEMKTGQDACKLLMVDPGNAIGTRIRIHSWNPEGAEKMEKILKTLDFFPLIEREEF